MTRDDVVYALFQDVERIIKIREILRMYWEIGSEEKESLKKNTTQSQALVAEVICLSIIDSFTVVLDRINDNSPKIKIDKKSGQVKEFTCSFCQLNKLLMKEDHPVSSSFGNALNKHKKLPELKLIKIARNKVVGHRDLAIDNIADELQPIFGDLIAPYDSSLDLMRIIQPHFNGFYDIDQKVKEWRVLCAHFKENTFPFLKGAEFADFMKQGLNLKNATK